MGRQTAGTVKSADPSIMEPCITRVCFQARLTHQASGLLVPSRMPLPALPPRVPEINFSMIWTTQVNPFSSETTRKILTDSIHLHPLR